MKIFGIGTDIVQHSRMLKIIQASYCERFLKKVLHPEEILKFQSCVDIQKQTQFLSSRWAVKEALVKAAGRVDIVFPQTLIQKDKNGRPNLILSGQNKDIFKDLDINESYVSISHEQDYSIAFVILCQ